MPGEEGLTVAEIEAIRDHLSTHHLSATEIASIRVELIQRPLLDEAIRTRVDTIGDRLVAEVSSIGAAVTANTRDIDSLKGWRNTLAGGLIVLVFLISGFVIPKVQEMIAVMPATPIELTPTPDPTPSEQSTPPAKIPDLAEDPAQ